MSPQIRKKTKILNQDDPLRKQVKMPEKSSSERSYVFKLRDSAAHHEMGGPTTGPYITLMTTKNFGAAGNCPDDFALSSFRCPCL